ncbi:MULTISPECIES: restriction endonuclease subunit S [Acinetobacter]|uniref:Restriction endonuclease subunit S n=1 Tax=Acinetobacter genomosp. 33YU TaxID=1675530 RepID=A0A1V2UZV8_9GAMM|nr:restriction endonuclease subunit S [Acinetobacter genomosp. 33YU]ONN55426.1 restriction endonuclease subunit S [Acinetobacter genomosp. 33YU]
MSFLEKLLKGVEIELKPIAEIGELVRGNGLPRTDFTESGVPAIHYGQIYTYYGLSTIETKSFVSSETAQKLKKVDTGDVIVTNTSENLEDVGKALVYLGTEQAVTGGHATIFKPSPRILGKYFAYYTQTEEFAQQKRKFAKGTKVIDVSATDLAKIKIPIPCPEIPKKSLEIQAEIVRILDAFSAMTAELTAELNVRKKQYNYYRDQLLSFKEGEVEWKTLDDLCNFVSSGKNKNKSSKGEFPVYGSTGVIARTDKYAYTGRQILVARVGANAGYVHLADGQYDVSDNTIILNVKDDYNLKFLFYILQNMRLRQYAKGAGQPLITSGQLKEFKIPIPSLAGQTCIVTILDKFDTLTNSLTEGLPREIKLRQQQYEYYRDLLFSFPKPEDVEA